MIALYAGAFLLALGLLVLIHELGHYFAARLCGVKVLRFAIGFGPVIWSRRFGNDQTEWAIGLLPLGGYVKMLDEREGDVAASELPRAFNQQTVGRRAFIVAAGPVANLLLAIFLYWLVFMAGMVELKPRLGSPPEGSPAAIAGIEAGFTVHAVNGKSIASWQDLRWEVMRQMMNATALELRGTTSQRLLANYRLDNLRFSLAEIEKDPLTPLGLLLYRPPLPAIVGQVLPNSAAAIAGFRTDDQVLEIDGKKISEWADVGAIISHAAGRPLIFTIQRDGQRMRLTATPQLSSEGGVHIGRLGLAVKKNEVAMNDMTTLVRYNPWEAVTRAIAKTWDTAIISLRMMGRMITGESSWKNLSGPVTIADYAGQTARLGLSYYLNFVALISISLGVLNLLPVPVLDGGHLMYYLAEFIKGKPFSDRVLAIGQQVGFALLALLMLFAFYNDFNRLFSS
jgi:regulator of sigma E protease